MIEDMELIKNDSTQCIARGSLHGRKSMMLVGSEWHWLVGEGEYSTQLVVGDFLYLRESRGSEWLRHTPKGLHIERTPVQQINVLGEWVIPPEGRTDDFEHGGLEEIFDFLARDRSNYEGSGCHRILMGRESLRVREMALWQGQRYRVRLILMCIPCYLGLLV